MSLPLLTLLRPFVALAKWERKCPRLKCKCACLSVRNFSEGGTHPFTRKPTRRGREECGRGLPRDSLIHSRPHPHSHCVPKRNAIYLCLILPTPLQFLFCIACPDYLICLRLSTQVRQYFLFL